MSIHDIHGNASGKPKSGLAVAVPMRHTGCMCRAEKEGTYIASAPPLLQSYPVSLLLPYQQVKS